jgi:hypothetical protein
MVTISILKNNKVIKQFKCTQAKKQSVFNKAVDMAGGMWNGVDDFSVKIS